MKYDAIIVGASFAGLAVASRLRGRVLLIDRKDIGTGQTSACGTLVSVPQALGCLDSVLQIYHRGFLHTPDRTIDYQLFHPFCALDYQRFCLGLAAKAEADFVKARVFGLKNGRIVTDRGEFEATCLIDASGWRAVLASSLDQGFVAPAALSFGVETTTPLRGSGLYFWVDPSVVDRGVGWLFPCGSYSRIGVGSYQREPRLNHRLASFMARFGATGDGLHGGFFPWRLRPPTVGNVFVVGDAGGQCLPLTAEGIRPALYFGLRCGDIVQQAIGGEISLDEGLRRYHRQVMRYRWGYDFLGLLQQRLAGLPSPWLTRLYLLFRFGPVWRFLLGGYDFVASLNRVGISPTLSRPKAEGTRHRAGPRHSLQ